MKKPITNTTDKIMHVGGCTIWPGQTREVEETLHPDYRPEPAPEVAPDPYEDLLALLDGNVSEVREGLSALADDELTVLEGLESEEQGGKGRKGVFEAIAEERLARAAAADIEAFSESLAGLDEAALLDVLDQVGGDMDRQQIVQDALDKLSPGD